MAKKTNDDDILIRIEGNEAEFRASMKSAERILDQSTKRMQKSLNGIDKNFGLVNKTAGQLKAGIAAIGLGFGLKELATGIFTINRDFQSLEAGLKVATGSADEASIAFSRLQEFASQTPYDLQQVITAFIKLKNLGLDPSNEAMRAYGDIAAAMPGKELNDFIEAAADAVVGEFERLKEFGIKASSEGDKVTFTFRGVATEVAKNARDIESYLQNLGRENFGGAMAEQMKMLGGAASNFSDNFQRAIVKLGQSTGIVDAMVASLNSLGDALGDFADAKPFDWEDDLKKSRAQVAALKAELATLPTNPFDTRYRRRSGVEDQIEGLEQRDAALQLARTQKQIAELEGRGITVSANRRDRTHDSEELARLIEYKAALEKVLEVQEKLTAKVEVATVDVTKPEQVELAKKTVKVLKDLQHEYDNLGRSAREVAVADALDRAGLKEGDAGAEKIRTLALALYDAAEAATAAEDALAEFDKRAIEQEGARIAVDSQIAALKEQNELLQSGVILSAGQVAAKEAEAEAAKNGYEITLAQKDAIRSLTDEHARLEQRQQRVKQLADDMAGAIGGAFEDAIVSGGELGDVLEGLGQDLLRMALQAAVIQPMQNAMSGLFGSIAGAFFADGGVMTSQGPLPLRTYSAGGIANTPQLAVYGEGKKPEAYVPLPDGRTIPVTMQGGGETFTYAPVFQVDARGSTLSRGEIKQIIDASVSRSVQAVKTMQKRGGSARL